MKRTFKFKKGDLVRVDRDWNWICEGAKYYNIGNINDFIGKEYIIGKVDIKDGGCYLDTTGWWFPESVLTMVKPFKPAYMYTLKLTKIRNETNDIPIVETVYGKFIDEDEFDELWARFVLEEEV